MQQLNYYVGSLLITALQVKYLVLCIFCPCERCVLYYIPCELYTNMYVVCIQNVQTVRTSAVPGVTRN